MANDTQSTPLLGQVKALIEQVQTELHKDPSLVGVPRNIARELVQAYAVETGKVLTDQHAEALQDERQSAEILLVLWGIPVLCFQMPQNAPMLCAWTWPGHQSLRDIEESTRYPGIPWRSDLEASPEDMMASCHRARRQATLLTEEHPLPIRWRPIVP